MSGNKYYEQDDSSYQRGRKDAIDEIVVKIKDIRCFGIREFMKEVDKIAKEMK
jgi:hypothetical protein